MLNPNKRLDRFEKEHGELTELLYNYEKAQTSQEKHKWNRLLIAHNKLVWLCMGYNIGYQEGLKKS
jgi:hypothetical protein